MVNDKDRIDNTIQLKDGRTLGYAKYGDPEGKPLFFFHGWPGSRFEAGLLHEQALNSGIRVVSIDRPGMGLSDFKKGRKLLDWPDDVIELADVLEFDRFSVLGLSGGGPYAVACAYKIPDRLSVVGIAASFGTPEIGTEGMQKSGKLMVLIGRRFPWLMRPLLWIAMSRNSQKPEKVEGMLENMAKPLPEPDQKAFATQEVKNMFIADLAASFINGTKGAVHDGKCFIGKWGFKLEEITHDKIYYWQGELDLNVPVTTGRSLAQAIPNCVAKFYPDTGHISMFLLHGEEILEVFK